MTAEFVIGVCRRLSQSEKSFRMSEHDLQARPVCRHGRDWGGTHLTTVSVALPVSRWFEAAAGRTIRKSVRPGATRSAGLRAGARGLTAAGLLPGDGCGALGRIGQHPRACSWWPGSGY